MFSQLRIGLIQSPIEPERIYPIYAGASSRIRRVGLECGLALSLRRVDQSATKVPIAPSDLHVTLSGQDES